jgi:hypothetical protein
MAGSTFNIELLQVYLTTKGDDTQELPFIFTPASKQRTMRTFNTPTLFLYSSTVFLDKKILTKNNINLKQLFTSYDLFEKVIKNLGDTFKTYSKEEIQKNNLDLFRKTFFPPKEKIPIRSRLMVIIKSSLKEFGPLNEVEIKYKIRNKTPLSKKKGIIQYGVVFELFVLDERRKLTDKDLELSNCKLKENELSNEAMELFGLSFGLDSEFSVPYSSTNGTAIGTANVNASRTNPYASSTNPYGMNPYGTNPYGSYNGYNTNPYGTNPYGSNMNSYGSNMNNPYGSTPSRNLGNQYHSIYRNLTNDQVKKDKEEIRRILNDLNKKNNLEVEADLAWDEYVNDQQNRGLNTVGKSEWIKSYKLENFKRKYFSDWLKYEERQKKLGKKAIPELWMEEKKEDILSAQIDFYMKRWYDFTLEEISDKKTTLSEWLNKILKREERRGGKGKKKKSIRIKKNRRINKSRKYKKYRV